MSRRLAREVAVRTLFQIDVGRANADRALAYSLEDYELPERDVAFAKALVQGVLSHQSDLDAVIARAARHWSIDRMANTDRNILRIAVYELLHAEDVPASVAVNEAVELAKTYGDADSGKFVNGILGFVLRESPRA